MARRISHADDEVADDSALRYVSDAEDRKNHHLRSDNYHCGRLYQSKNTNEWMNSARRAQVGHKSARNESIVMNQRCAAAFLQPDAAYQRALVITWHFPVGT